jgi:hypothetical protein
MAAAHVPLARSAQLAHPALHRLLRRLASGRLVLERHAGTVRSHLTAYLSEDNGHTLGPGLLLDERSGVSDPDAVEGPPGQTRLVYDYNRKTAGKQVLLSVFHESDVQRGSLAPAARTRQIVNQATGRNPITQPYEVALFGATPAGIAAAISARREGVRHVVLADASAHVGGRFAETIGFGEIQRMKPVSVGGLWTELRAKVDAHDGKKNGHSRAPRPENAPRLLPSRPPRCTPSGDTRWQPGYQ